MVMCKNIKESCDEMKYIKKILLFAVLSIGGLYADLQAIEQNNLALQDPIAGYIIQAMQDCIDFNEDVHWKLLGVQDSNIYFNNIIDNQSGWEKAVALYHKYINELRQKYNTITRPELTLLPEISKDADLLTRLIIQANQAQFLFSRLLDEYIAHLGQVYDKKSGLLGLYKTSYYISSRNNRSLPITPNEYTLLLKTLDKATQQKDWVKSVDLKVLVAQENGSILEKTLNLHEIINAIKQVPLPVDYFTATTIGAGVVAAAAIGAGAYLAYQAYNTPTPTNVQMLEKEVIAIKNQVDALSATITPSTPPADNTKKSLPVAPSNNQNKAQNQKTATPFSQNKPTLNSPEISDDKVRSAQPAIEKFDTTPTTKSTRRSGLQRYLDDIASNPDFDNPMNADTYVQPDAADKYLANIPIHVANDVINLPRDVANRAQITYKNINSGNYKPGQTAQKLMEKSVEASEDYANGSIDPSLEDRALQNFDSGDQALLNTTNALYLGTGLARAATNRIARKTSQSIDQEMADFANYGKSKSVPPAPALTSIQSARATSTPPQANINEVSQDILSRVEQQLTHPDLKKIYEASSKAEQASLRKELEKLAIQSKKDQAGYHLETSQTIPLKSNSAPSARVAPEPAPRSMPEAAPAQSPIVAPAPRSIPGPAQTTTPPALPAQPTVDAAQSAQATQNALEANTGNIFENLSNTIKSGYDKAKTAGQSMMDKARQAAEEASNKFLDKSGNKIAGETAQGVDQGITNFGNYGKNAGVSNFEQTAMVQATKPARLGQYYEYLPEGYVKAA